MHRQDSSRQYNNVLQREASSLQVLLLISISLQVLTRYCGDDDPRTDATQRLVWMHIHSIDYYYDTYIMFLWIEVLLTCFCMPEI